MADVRPRALNGPTTVRRSGRSIDDMRAHDDAKAAVHHVFEFDALSLPDRFDGAQGRPTRLRVTLFELMHGALSEPDTLPKLALAPTQDRASRPDLGSKATPLETHELDKIGRASGAGLHDGH